MRAEAQIDRRSRRRLLSGVAVPDDRICRGPPPYPAPAWILQPHRGRPACDTPAVGGPRCSGGSMPYQRLAQEVLAQWRAAERDLEAVAAEAERLHGEIERLRAEYHRLIEEATAARRPVPPPLPDAD